MKTRKSGKEAFSKEAFSKEAFSKEAFGRGVFTPVLCLLGFSLVTDIVFAASDVVTPRRVNRIIPLTPSLAELVSEFSDGKDRIVAVTEYSDFPEILTRKEKIGGYHHLNYERISALKPDLLLVAEGGNAPFEVETLRRQHPGTEFLLLRENSFDDLLKNVELVGNRLGLIEEAEALKAKWKKRKTAILSRAQGRKLKNVVILVEENPLIVAGGPTYFTELLNWIGAKNGFEDLAVKYPRISKEELLKRNPDVVVTLQKEPSPAFKSTFRSTHAVRMNRIFAVKSDALARPGPRMLEAAEILERAFESEVK